MSTLRSVTCWSGCLLLSQALLLADPAADIQRAASRVQRGERALEAGNLDRARQLFHQALRAQPAFPEAHFGLGHAAMRGQRFEDALGHYTTARAAYAEMGSVRGAYELDRYDRAQKEIRRLEDEIRVINNPVVKVSEATRRTKALQLRQAIQTLRALPFPGDPEVHEPPPELHFHTGNALFRLGRQGEAVVEWEACVEKKPEFALVYNNLAVAYMNQGRLRKARQSLDAAEEHGLTVNPRLAADIERRTTASRE